MNKSDIENVNYIFEPPSSFTYNLTVRSKNSDNGISTIGSCVVVLACWDCGSHDVRVLTSPALSLSLSLSRSLLVWWCAIHLSFVRSYVAYLSPGVTANHVLHWSCSFMTTFQHFCFVLLLWSLYIKYEWVPLVMNWLHKLVLCWDCSVVLGL